jgi:choice-of-anchor A domain-containing protein
MPPIAKLFDLFLRERNAGGRKCDFRARLAPFGLEVLEGRDLLSGVPVDLGVAAQFSVLGLQRTVVWDQNATITGDVGVSQRGFMFGGPQSTITGNIDEFARREYFGSAQVGGSIVVDSALMKLADQDALSASATAAALTTTQTFRRINQPTLITGNGSVNVIQINGNITSSLTLSGSATDVFIVNVRGNVNLRGGAGLGLAGGVTADHVLYNFTGRNGSIVVRAGDFIDGTLLAPRYTVRVSGGVVNGEIISGRDIFLTRGAQITHIAFNASVVTANGSISGFAFVDNVGNGLRDPSKDNPFPGIVVTLTGTDSSGKPVNLTATTDSNGFYTFTGLLPGTYTLTFPQPASGGTAELGSLGTSVQGLTLTINLPAGGQGSNYNLAVNPNPS